MILLVEYFSNLLKKITADREFNTNPKNAKAAHTTLIAKQPYSSPLGET
jgi:hypothetical protein